MAADSKPMKSEFPEYFAVIVCVPGDLRPPGRL
jgi:hypothetical protein